jgi:hypothetical protein
MAITNFIPALHSGHTSDADRSARGPSKSVPSLYGFFISIVPFFYGSFMCPPTLDAPWRRGGLDVKIIFGANLHKLLAI